MVQNVKRISAKSKFAETHKEIVHFWKALEVDEFVEEYNKCLRHFDYDDDVIFPMEMFHDLMGEHCPEVRKQMLERGSFNLLDDWFVFVDDPDGTALFSMKSDKIKADYDISIYSLVMEIIEQYRAGIPCNYMRKEFCEILEKHYGRW